MPEKPYYQNDVSYIKVNGEWYGATFNALKTCLGVRESLEYV